MNPDTFKRAKVTLVGAGPGDPDLLTLKAVKAIQAATVLLVDDLVNPDIAALAPATARVVQVGKRGGCKSTPQAFIERLMVLAAREGENVVRLKGGDPFIFGRGGEEVEHLREAGIDVEVVTGHAHPGADGIEWPALAQAARDARLTLVIYMGVSGAGRIQQGLLSALPATTPVAIVQKATLPDQREAVTTLGELQATIDREQLASPSVIVVGDVLRGVAAIAQAPSRRSAAG